MPAEELYQAYDSHSLQAKPSLSSHQARGSMRERPACTAAPLPQTCLQVGDGEVGEQEETQFLVQAMTLLLSVNDGSEL